MVSCDTQWSRELYIDQHLILLKYIHRWLHNHVFLEKHSDLLEKYFPWLNTTDQYDFEVSKPNNLELSPVQSNNFVHDSEYTQDMFAGGMDEGNNENYQCAGYQYFI